MRNLTTILIGVLLLPWLAYLSWPATMETPAPRIRMVKVTQPQPPAMAPVSYDDAEAYKTQPKVPAQPSV